jgi:hypothetical protein
VVGHERHQRRPVERDREQEHDVDGEQRPQGNRPPKGRAAKVSAASGTPTSRKGNRRPQRPSILSDHAPTIGIRTMATTLSRPMIAPRRARLSTKSPSSNGMNTL